MDSSVLNARGYVGEIRSHESATKVDKHGEQVVSYFAKISIPYGDVKDRKYQYVSCIVSKSLVRLVKTLLESQVCNENDRVNHALSSQMANIRISNPYFEVKDGYCNGTGVLESISFE